MNGYEKNLFTPPAPFAKVKLRNIENGAELEDVPMLIDTGADVSLIPKSPVKKLNISVDSEAKYELLGFDGNRSVAEVVHLEMFFLKKKFKGQFLLIEQEWGILGRDVLNNVSLFFDGPKLVWGENNFPKS